jgi:hypothetical protein
MSSKKKKKKETQKRMTLKTRKQQHFASCRTNGRTFWHPPSLPAASSSGRAADRLELSGGVGA